MLLAHGLLILQALQMFFGQSFFLDHQSSVCSAWRFISLQVQDFAFFHDVSVDPFLQTVQICLNSNASLSFESSANFLRLHSCPTTSWPLMKFLSNSGLGLNPCSLSVMTTPHQLVCVQVTVTLWTWDWGEDGKSVVFWILLCALLKDGNGICFLSSPQEPLPVAVTFQRYLRLASLVQGPVPSAPAVHPQYKLLGPVDAWICSLFKCSLTCSSSTKDKYSWTQSFFMVLVNWNSFIS